MTEEELLKRFTEVESKVKTLLIKAFYSEKSNTVVRRIVYQDIEKLVAYLQQGTDAYVTFTVSNEYKNGLQNAAEQLLAAKFIDSSAIQLQYATDFTKAPKSMHVRVVTLIDSYQNAFADTFRATRATVKKSLTRVLFLKDTIDEAKDILDAVSRSEAISLTKSRAMAEVFKGKSLDDVAKAVAKDMRKVVGTDGAVMFRDRAGRRWSFQRYAKLMTTDITNKSYREGQRGNFMDIGLDIVKTNDTGTKDSCLVWQGVPFSLSGLTPGFPTYMDIVADGTHMFSFGCLHELIYIDPEEVVKKV